MKRFIFISVFLTLFSLCVGSCSTLQDLKESSFVSSVAEAFTERTLTKVFGADYSLKKDSVFLETELHYLKLQNFIGEKYMKKLTKKGFIILETAEKSTEILWHYNDKTENVKLVFRSVKIKD
jgi:hypothetical protein